jgi:acetolactate synthase-1/2/3 large subunit
MILGGRNELIAVIEKGKPIPAAWTILGASAVPTDHDLNEW